MIDLDESIIIGRRVMDKLAVGVEKVSSSQWESLAALTEYSHSLGASARASILSLRSK